MKAGVLFVGLLLIAWGIPAQAHGGGGGHGGGGHGGGGHAAGHSGGHGFHFGGHHGHGKHGKAGVAGWRGVSSASAIGRMAASPRVTTFVGFGSVPGRHVVFISDHFFCPFAPNFIFPFCPVCSFPGPFHRHGFFGFAGGGFWPFFDVEDGSPQPVVGNRKLPVLVFTNGWSFEVTDYWIDDERELRYTTSYGGSNIVSLESLDLYATVKANAERGIPFTLRVQHQP